MADPALNGLYPKQLDEQLSIALDAWLVFQADEIDDQAFRISLTNFIAALPVIPAVAGEYADIAALLVAQPGQTIDVLYRVINPIADPAFNDLPDAEVKSVYYHLPGDKNGLLSDYNSIAFPKLGSDKNSKLGNSLDAFTFDIKFRTAEWSSNQATLQAAANALDLSSPQDLKLTGEAVKLITGNDPADISRVMFGLDGQLIFEPIPTGKIQSDSSAADVTLNDSYQEILSITGGQDISSALANIGLTAKSFATGSITVFADAGDGRLRVTSTTHGLSEGQFVEIVNTSNYDGIYEIKAVPNINDFDITKAFVSTETGDWEISANREIAIDLRVNEISVKVFTRQIEGKGRLNFSESITGLINTEDIDIFAKSNTFGEAIELLGTDQSSELKVVNLDLLKDGSGTTFNVDKVDLGGVLSAIATIRKNNNIIFQILKQAAGDDGEYQQFIMSNTEFFQHFRSLAGDLSVAIGMEKSGAGVQAGGGLYISTSDLAGGADKVSGMNFGKTGLIIVGDIAGSGRAIGEMYDSDYHAKWELLSAANRERIHPDIEWVELNQIEVVTWYVNPSASGGNGSPTKPYTVNEAMAAASEGDVIFFQPGTYTDDITVTKDNLTFVGYNLDVCKIDVTNFVIDTDAQQITLILDNLDIDVTNALTQGTNPALVTFKNINGIFSGGIVVYRIEKIIDSFIGSSSGITTSSFTLVRNSTVFGGTWVISGTSSFQKATITGDISAAGRTLTFNTCDVDGDVNCANLTYNNTVITGTKVGTSSTVVNNQFTKQEIAATLAIPFNISSSRIAALTISGPTEFTVDTTDAEFDNIALRRVTADGTNEPTFASPFQKLLSSRDYDNTAGVVNIIGFWFDGVSYLYSITQPTPIVLPTIVSFTMSADNTYGDLVLSTGIYGEDDGSTPAALADLSVVFAANGGTATDWVESSAKQNDSETEGGASALAGGETTIRIFGAISGTADGQETVTVGPTDGASLYDAGGVAMDSGESAVDNLNIAFSNTKSIDFNGTSQHLIRNQKQSELEPIGASKAMSWSFWIKPDSVNDNRSVIWIGRDSPTLGLGIVASLIDSSHGSVPDFMDFIIYGSDNTKNLIIRSGAAFTAGSWYHVLITYDEATKTLKLYRNAVESGNATTDNSFDAYVDEATRRFRIGNQGLAANPDYYKGLVDEVDVYDKVLNQGEVTEIYNGGSPNDLSALGSYSNNVSWWRMENDLTDEKSGYTLTNIGSTPFNADVP